MKYFFKLIAIIIFTNLNASNINLEQDPYLEQNLLKSIKEIPISKLLDYKRMANAITDPFTNARFHYIHSYEINRRLKNLDKKFYSQEKKYLDIIHKYENELDITSYNYTNQRPQFSHTYQPLEISEETIAAGIHQMQTTLVRTQFIQVYKYYRKRLDNYKNHLNTLRELYACKIEENKENKVEFYSNFSQMYQGIKIFHDAMDDAGKMRVQRDALGKVEYIEWHEEGEKSYSRRRNMEYYNNGTLSKLTDTIEEHIVYETWFGENDIAENFINYIFSPGFIPRDYNYYTEVYYSNNRPDAYKISTLDDHVIGTIYREYDDKGHLSKEAWCKGETSKLLREFTSIFDPASGGYKLIERDRNGNIVSQEIILSSND